jgi:site-specific DNA-cytosine methylase
VSLLRLGGNELVHAFGIEKEQHLREFVHASLRTPVCFSNIRDVSLTELGPCDIFQFSPPCIPFASQGGGLGDEHVDADLVERCVQYLAMYKPGIFVYENVPGVTFKKHKVYLLRVLRALRKVGNSCYKVFRTMLDSFTHAGMPMGRYRFFLVGFKRDQYNGNLKHRDRCGNRCSH